jgi:hypothetical protein
LETVKLLLDYGADINIKDDDGNSPLHLATFKTNVTSSLETVKLLLDYGTDINIKGNKGWSPLHISVYYSNHSSSLETVKLLLDSGADISIKTDNGENAIDLAFHINETETPTLIESEIIRLLMCYATYDVLNGCYYTCKKNVYQNMIRLHLFTMIKGLSKDTLFLISKQFKIQSSVDYKDMENIMSYELNIDVKSADNQQILSKSSEKQKIWMANKMIYYSELDHRTDGKDERLPFVANLYKRALAQCKLNEFIENAPGILEPELIKELQCKIQKTQFV